MVAEAVRHQCRARTRARSGCGRFTARMPATDNDDVEAIVHVNLRNGLLLDKPQSPVKKHWRCFT